MAPSRACSASRLWGAARKGMSSVAADPPGASTGLRRAGSIMGARHSRFRAGQDGPSPQCTCRADSAWAGESMPRPLLAGHAWPGLELLLRKQTPLLRKHIVAGDRKRVDAFCELQLEHRQAAVPEAGLAALQVIFPHAAEAIVEACGVEHLYALAVRLETTMPLDESSGIVQPKVLEIGQPKIARFQQRRELRQRRYVGAREDVL